MLKFCLPIFAIVTITAGQMNAPPSSSEKPVTLIRGLGTWRHPIATKNSEAQKFFDQGLALLYAFNRYEALRSFKKAAELDRTAPMPWWGIAMAQGPHINMDSDGDVDLKKSCAAVETARKLPSAPENERAWIEAVATRCPEYRPSAYSEAMAKLANRYPDDLDVVTFYAESLMVPVRWRWYDKNGRPAEGVTEGERSLQTVIRRQPDHIGANHFYIHAVESSPTPERALQSAQKLMGLAPAAGHLVHMPAHIWLVLGEYETAATLNEQAARIDLDYMKNSGVTESAYFGYYVHNLHFVTVARSMQGRMHDAIAAADQMSAAVGPMAASMPEMADAFYAMPFLVRARFGRWDELLSIPAPDGKLAVSAAVHHYGRALALKAKGRGAEAVGEQKAFEACRARLPRSAMWLNNKAADVLAIASEVLAGRLAGSPATATPRWRRAVALQDALVYDEPPGWYYPVRESLGAALLQAGKPEEAEAVFREGLNRSPRNGRMLFGLLQCLKSRNDRQAADWVNAEFQSAWRNADVTLRIEDL